MKIKTEDNQCANMPPKQGKAIVVKGKFRMLKRTNTYSAQSLQNATSTIRNIPRRGSTNSLDSDIEEENENDTALSTQSTKSRVRRGAIYHSKNYIEGKNSTDRSPNDSGTEDNSQSDRRRSSLDIAMQVLPGVDVLKEQHKKILKKQNTIADLTHKASLSSASVGDDNKKKGISILKLMEKKGKPRDTLADLHDALASIKASEFRDNYLISFKEMHWTDLMSKQDNCLQNFETDISEMEKRRREAVWEIFKSELIFLVDHLMVLKHCFLEPLKKLQVDGFLMFVEPQDLFGNIDELCYVSYTFCRDLISSLTKEMTSTEFGQSDILLKAFKRWLQSSKDGEVFHNYCLNYNCALTYIEILRKYELFAEFEKWCEQDIRCNRLQITDLLVAPMQHCTKIPLLLSKIRKYTENVKDKQMLTEKLEKVESSLKQLEDKMKWLTNFERLQEIQQQLLWPNISDLEPRVFIPEFLRQTLSKQPCERLIANPKRQLSYEGFLNLCEGSKTIEVYTFLFDDILLITKIKKPPKKKSMCESIITALQYRSPTDGALFTVYRQPIALDRFSLHDVGYAEANANGLKNAFVLVQISRFQQIIGVYTLQASNEIIKTVWVEKLRESQSKFQEKLKAKLVGHSQESPKTNKHSKLITKLQRLHACTQHHIHTCGQNRLKSATPSIDISTTVQNEENVENENISCGSKGFQFEYSQEILEKYETMSNSSSTKELSHMKLFESYNSEINSTATSRSANSPSIIDCPACLYNIKASRGLTSETDNCTDACSTTSFMVQIQAPFSPPLSPTLHSFVSPLETPASIHHTTDDSIKLIRVPKIASVSPKSPRRVFNSRFSGDAGENRNDQSDDFLRPPILGRPRSASDTIVHLTPVQQVQRNVATRTLANSSPTKTLCAATINSTDSSLEEIRCPEQCRSASLNVNVGSDDQNENDAASQELLRLRRIHKDVDSVYI